MSTIITPTVGRPVWFWPKSPPLRGVLLNDVPGHPEQPCAATVIFVHNERKVNLSVLGHSGSQQFVPNVPLQQEGDDVPDSATGFATWMPYQLGQAKKDQLHPVLAAINPGLSD